MRWFEAALAARGSSRRRQGRRLGAAVLAAALCLAAAGAGAAAAGARTGVFTGYGFETCNAPTADALTAWLASPYRAVGIYIGGVNRTCANTELTPTWTAAALGAGWSLIPTYVGLQAPCITDGTRATSPRRTRRARASRPPTTRSRARGARPPRRAARSTSTWRPTRSTTPRARGGAGVRHRLGRRAARPRLRGRRLRQRRLDRSRDMQALADTPASPDSLWIANWNGNESVFGDPYVSDTLWTNHQRIHQYRGGHKETWGGVTIDIDSDFVDGPVVSGAAAVAAAAGAGRGLGSVSTPDGMASVTWPAGAIDDGHRPPARPVRSRRHAARLRHGRLRRRAAGDVVHDADARAGVRGAADAAVRAAQRAARAGLLDERHGLEARAAARRRRDRARRANRATRARTTAGS